MIDKNRFVVNPNLHDAFLILYPKISKYELEIMIALLRRRGWIRVRKLAIETSIPRTKVYGVLERLRKCDLVEEQKIAPVLNPDWSVKRRSQEMKAQGFKPMGEAQGYKRYRLKSVLVLERLNWVMAGLKNMRESLEV